MNSTKKMDRYVTIRNTSEAWTGNRGEQSKAKALVMVECAFVNN
jgi:hypothetical protein